MSAGMSGDWNAERELWLAFRAIRAEVNRLAGGLEKAVKWMNMAEAKYLEMKRGEEANPPSRGDPNAPGPRAGTQSGDVSDPLADEYVFVAPEKHL